MRTAFLRPVVGYNVPRQGVADSEYLRMNAFDHLGMSLDTSRRRSQADTVSGFQSQFPGGERVDQHAAVDGVFLAHFGEPRHHHRVGKSVQALLERNREVLVARLLVFDHLRSFPEWQWLVVIERPVFQPHLGKLAPHVVSGALDEFKIKGDTQVAIGHVGFFRSAVAHRVPVLLEPVQPFAIAVDAARVLIPEFFHAIAFFRVQQVFRLRRIATHHVQDVVPVIPESHPLRQFGQDVIGIARISHRFDDRLPQRVAGDRRRLQAIEQVRLEVGVGRQEYVRPLRRLGVLDVNGDDKLHFRHDLLDLVGFGQVPQRIRVVEEYRLGLVVQAEFLRIQESFGVELPRVETNWKPLHQMGRIRWIFEWRRGMQLVRLRLQHSIFSRMHEEAAVIQRHAEVAARHINVAHQHVDHLERQIVEQAVGMRLRAAVIVQGRGPERIRLSLDFDSRADLCRFHEFLRDTADRLGWNRAYFGHPLGSVIG